MKNLEKCPRCQSSNVNIKAVTKPVLNGYGTVADYVYLRHDFICLDCGARKSMQSPTQPVPKSEPMRSPLNDPKLQAINQECLHTMRYGTVVSPECVPDIIVEAKHAGS